MAKRLKGLLNHAAQKTPCKEAKKTAWHWEYKAWALTGMALALCLLVIFNLRNPLRFGIVICILLLWGTAAFFLIRSYTAMLVRTVCDRCDPALALDIMKETSRLPVLGLFTGRNVETLAAVLNCMMLEGREDQARQAMKEMGIHSKDWDYHRTVLLCMYHYMKKDSMEIDKEYGDLGWYAARNYKDARQNFRWMQDMKRLTDLEDLYGFVKDPKEKNRYKEELTALLEEKLELSGNKAQRLQIMFRLAQIELKEQEYDKAAERLEEIAREGNSLGVASQSRQILTQLMR